MALPALIIAGVVAWRMRPKAPKTPYRTASVLVGAVFGADPSWQASRLDPIEGE